ncbi:SRPBCC family protein [Streptomyces sp. NBC_00859]|uniref:SRPBCC family protein n=1 Tax=Streptomyces sp. NBC_00859 TaxID=2903682 RepID=UPI0038630442|nr:SRPBCC family protein [Streptomyces sp. NBC_00859]
MIKVERVIQLAHSPEEVISYLADFSRTESWDPGTVSCRRVGSGPLVVGAQWQNVSEFRGRRTELRYTLTQRDADRLVFTGRNKTATSTDDLSVEAQGEGTRLTYRARIAFHGVARFATPFLKGEFERLGDEVSERLPTALDRDLGSASR